MSSPPPQAKTSRPPLRKRLASNPLVLDGAMGTVLNERGIAFNECFELANVDRAQLVTSVHRTFLDAGSEGVHTNTFGLNRYRLGGHGLTRRLQELAEAAAANARQAAGDQRYVIASLGPTGVAIEPIGRVAHAEARHAYQEAAAAFDEGVIDGYSLETFSNLFELIEAARGIREVSDLPLFAHFTVTGAGVTLMGTHPEEACVMLEKEGVDAIGVNCSTGPGAVLDASLKMLETCSLPISARPNAGLPRESEGRVFYENNPDYFARFARRFLQAGGQILGGCCGTTPDHIRAISRAARAVGSHHRERPVVHVAPHQARPETPVPLAERSNFGRLLAEKKCPISVELLPPRTPDTTALLKAAQKLKDVGVDLINLPDGPRASARISNMVAGHLIEREVGLETLLHICCRDRNLLGMQSDLMGAAALGMANLLIITGDPPYQGNYPDVTAVFDVDAIGLCNIVDNLNHGLDVGGNHLDGQTHFCFGAALNQTATDPEREYSRFEWKIKAGVEFAITQPVFDADAFLKLLPTLPADRPPILAGLWPLRSLRNAEFLAAEVPGVEVPDETVDRMRKADAAGKAAEEGLLIAGEILQKLMGHVDGFQIAAPFNKTEATMELVKTARKFQ